MKKSLLTFLLLQIILCASAQYKITGKVINAESKKPIASASVFFSNTSKGTTTNEQGEFILDNITDGRYDLVVSCVSYETHVQNIQPSKTTALLNIELKAKTTDLKEVVVGGYVKEGWNHWGKFFLNNFIGQMPDAADCSIKNTESIQFRNYKKQRLLKAFSDETLVIENKSLGYIIHYRLELFQYDFTSRLLTYQGYPLFKQMETNRSRKEKKWAAKREKIYYGSQLHFMRSLYRNKIAEEGFEIRKLIKLPNLEKQRVQALYRKSMFAQSENGTITIGNPNANLSKDSAAYYENILSQPNEKETVFPELLTGDSIAYSITPTVAGLDFTDYLRITYTKSKEETDYLLQFGLKRQPMAPVSLLTLINKKPIEVLSNGFYYEALELLNSGYWAWSEKMATMLPYDYWPNKK